MISGLDPATEKFLASINDLQTRMDTVQNQLSSGVRVAKASDSPQQVEDIFQARADMGRAGQIERNLSTVKAQVDAGDSTLQTAVQLLEQAALLGVRGASGTATLEQQQTYAGQVRSLQEQLVALSRTQVAGVYIFSGDNSGSPAYQVNTASPTGVDRLFVAQATQQIQDPTGVTFPIGVTAQDLFDKRDGADGVTPENVFAALQQLQAALQIGDVNAISQAIGSVHTADSYLNQQLSFYGAAQNRINSSIDLAQKFQLQSKTQLSSLEDTDVTSAAIELTRTSTALNAALASESKRRTTTLFDYLPIG